jgi:putative peptide zinc metalloprotease protein
MSAVFRRALTCAVLLLACVLPLGSAQAAPDIRPKDNVALAQIATDAGHDFDFSWEIRKQRGGTVDHLNSAQAYSQCLECGATAIAFQIVLASDSNVVIPRNEAVAINNECTNCVTVAEARQFVRVYPRAVRITGAGRAVLDDVRTQLDALATQNLDVAALHTAVEAQEARVNEVLANDIVLRADPGTEADVLEHHVYQDNDLS